MIKNDKIIIFYLKYCNYWNYIYVNLHLILNTKVINKQIKRTKTNLNILLFKKNKYYMFMSNDTHGIVSFGSVAYTYSL